MITGASRILLIGAFAAAMATAATAQQSQVQRCLSVPRNGATAEAEYCRGIFAANGSMS